MEEKSLGNLWRNEIVREYKIMDELQFNKLSCIFKCDYDPKAKSSMTKKFFEKDFKQVFGGNETDALEHQNELFKLAAKSEIDALSSNTEKVSLSTKYQVLCDATSFIGVIKQKNKNDNEIEKIEVKTATVSIPKPQPAPVVNNYGYNNNYSYNSGYI